MLKNCFPGRNEIPDWNNLGLTSRNCLPARCSLIPYPGTDSCKQAVNDHRRYLSQFVHHINGSWNYKYFEQIDQLPERILTFRSGYESIILPQALTAKQSSTAKSTAADMFPCLPPLANPWQGASVFHKSVSLPLFWNSFRKKLVIMGAGQACHVYVNGLNAGFCQNIDSTKEIDITHFWHDGENDIHIIAYDHCSTSYISKNTASAGIVYRDLYIEALPSLSLFDVNLNTTAGDSGWRTWNLDIDAELISYRISQDKPLVSLELFYQNELITRKTQSVTLSPVTDNQCYNSPVQTKGRLNSRLSLHDILAWTSETPYIYDLFLTVSDHNGIENVSYHLPVGFRSIGRTNNQLLINGKPLFLKVAGYDDHIIKDGDRLSDKIVSDLIKIRQTGFNCILCIDKTIDPVLLDIADMIGVYVLAGFGINATAEFAEHLSADSLPEWNKHLEYMSESIIKRDRNHPSLLGWQVESDLSGWPDQAKLVKHIKHLDTGRLLIFDYRTDCKQQNNLYMAKLLEQDLACLSISDCAESAASNKLQQELLPRFYNHLNLGQAADLTDYQSWLNKTSSRSEGVLGIKMLDFVDRNNPETGLVNSQNELTDLGKFLMSSQLPLDISFDYAANKILVTCLYKFAGLGNLSIGWSRHKDLNWLDQGSTEIELLKAGDTAKISLSGQNNSSDNNYTHVNLHCSWYDRSWIHRPLRQSCRRFFKAVDKHTEPAGLPPGRFAAISQGQIRLEQDRHLLLISGHRFWFIFNRINGSFESWRCGETELLELSNPYKQAGPSWQLEHQDGFELRSMNYWSVPISVEFDCDGENAVIETRSLLAAGQKAADYEIFCRYDINKQGQLKMLLTLISINTNTAELSRASVRFGLKRQMTHLNWFGTTNQGLDNWLQLNSQNVSEEAISSSCCDWLYAGNDQSLGLMIRSDRQFAFTCGLQASAPAASSNKFFERSWLELDLNFWDHTDCSYWQNQLLPADRSQLPSEFSTATDIDGSNQNSLINGDQNNKIIVKKQFSFQPMAQMQ